MFVYERWVRRQQQALLAGDPKHWRRTGSGPAGTERFCWCCKLEGNINGEEDWETAQKGLADLELCNSKSGWKKILETTQQSTVFLRRLNMTWWEEKRWNRLTRCQWAAKGTQRWKGQIYSKELLNKAFPGETRECQFHYTQSWWNLSWAGGQHSGHLCSTRMNSHLKSCTSRTQQCSGNRKFPCGTPAINTSATWGCGKTLALLSLIQRSSSQCREDLEKNRVFQPSRMRTSR